MRELLRMYHVLMLFERKKHCTKEDILAAAGKLEGRPISYETWNRLRKKMNLDYGFEVIYNKADDSSSLIIHDTVDYEKLMEMITHFRTGDLLQAFVKGDKRMIEHLDFEPGIVNKNEGFFNLLKDAMLNTETVLITHQGYWSESPKTREVNPLYFKQYQNRWYLIAEDKVSKAFKSFGMDRILMVEFMHTKFKSRMDEAKSAYSKVVGLDLTGNGLQDIVIAFDPTQKPYVESLRFHDSQVVVKDTPETYVIKIRVNPNYELQQQIQKYGELAEVLEGEWVCF